MIVLIEDREDAGVALIDESEGHRCGRRFKGNGGCVANAKIDHEGLVSGLVEARVTLSLGKSASKSHRVGSWKERKVTLIRSVAFKRGGKLAVSGR